MMKYREIENPTVEKVQSGDRVTFTTPQNTKMGEVTATAYGYSGTTQLFVAGYGLNTMGILKIERPVPSFPEEDGLYTLARAGAPVENYRVLRRKDGRWEELSLSGTPSRMDDLKGMVEKSLLSVTRLVMEDSNGQ